MSDMIARGIDVSKHNGTIDWKKVKASGIGYAIIRAGLGWGLPTSKDPMMDAHVKGCLNNGIPFGFYHYSYASTVEEAVQEANYFLDTVREYRPEYPLYLDQEYNSPVGRMGMAAYRQLRTDICKAFLDTLQDAGYYAALYSSTDWLNNWVFDNQLAAYDKWVAQYSAACTYQGTYGMWQYSVIGTQGTKGKDYWMYGTVPGVTTNCDVNFAYKDYPSIIKKAGLNGWGKQPETEQLEAEIKRLKEAYSLLESRFDELNAQYCDRIQAIRRDLIALHDRI